MNQLLKLLLIHFLSVHLSSNHKLLPHKNSIISTCRNVCDLILESCTGSIRHCSGLSPSSVWIERLHIVMQLCGHGYWISFVPFTKSQVRFAYINTYWLLHTPSCSLDALSIMLIAHFHQDLTCDPGNTHDPSFDQSLTFFLSSFFLSFTLYLPLPSLFFLLRGLPYPLAIQASDSRVTAAARAINTVCLVSFLAGCIKHWMAVADYSWDAFPYTCWVWEIQVNGETLPAAQWDRDRQELGHFDGCHVTLDERRRK